MRRVTFVGLGNMGRPMAQRLAVAGFEVSGFDASPDARDAAMSSGIAVVDRLNDAASTTDILILMLPTSAIVERVLITDGILELLPVGAVVVDMGSSNPMESRRLAGLAAKDGRAFVDAPVSGGVGGAVAGSLTIMIGGSSDDVDPLHPVFEAMGSQIRHVGPVGAGHALKAINNLLSATHLLVSSEALLVGHEFGLDYASMLEVINSSSGRSGSTEAKWPKFVLPGTYDSGFGLALMAKDMNIAIDLGHQLGWSTPLSDASTALWVQASNDMPPGADHTQIVEWLKTRHAE
jgi:3-hydroxyisobutyrate dehydrogenase